MHPTSVGSLRLAACVDEKNQHNTSLFAHSANTPLKVKYPADNLDLQAEKEEKTRDQTWPLKFLKTNIIAFSIGLVMALSTEAQAAKLVKAVVEHPRPQMGGSVNSKSIKNVLLSSRLIVGSQDRDNERYMLKSGQLNYKREISLKTSPSNGAAMHSVTGSSYSNARGYYSVGGSSGSSSLTSATMGISITIVDLD